MIRCPTSACLMISRLCSLLNFPRPNASAFALTLTSTTTSDPTSSLPSEQSTSPIRNSHRKPRITSRSTSHHHPSQQQPHPVRPSSQATTLTTSHHHPPTLPHHHHSPRIPTILRPTRQRPRIATTPEKPSPCPTQTTTLAPVTSKETTRGSIDTYLVALDEVKRITYSSRPWKDSRSRWRFL